MSDQQFSDGYYSRLKDRLILFRKEWFGVNYLLFTPYRLISTLAIIFFAGILAFFSNKNGFTDSTTDVMQIQWNLLDDYVLGLNISIIIIAWYYIVFLWSSIHKNGDYGYWISLGVKREKFFLTSVLTFVLGVFFAVLSSYLVLTTVGGLDFNVQDTVSIYLILLTNIILLTGVAWILTELINNFEIVSVIFLGAFGISNFVFRDNDNLIFKILLPTFNLADYDLIFNFLIPLVIGLGLLFGSYKLNLKREIEI